ncbi:MAG TPA: hypothetical protein VFV99_06135 [Kofleriaceae bacterium]|nr:hypothetical protein [Kofleriaceae bacterium]
MGYVSRHKRRDLSKYQTIYEDPEYDRLAASLTSRDDKVTAGMLAGGSTLETMGGLAAVILSVIGFEERANEMGSIATIAIGIALLSHGASLMARWGHAFRRVRGARPDRDEMVESIGTEVFGGVVGIVLGVIALVGIKPAVILPVAAIVYGSSLLLGGASQPDLVYLAPETNPRYARVTFSAIQASGGIMVLVGVAAAVLGVLALLEVGPPISLALVAMLSIGFSLLFAGGALTARFVRRFT